MMAFEELTDHQREILVAVAEKLATGRFDSELWHLSTLSAGGILILHGNDGHDRDQIPDVALNDVAALEEEGYMTIRRSGDAQFVSLKQKALREYRQLIGESVRTERNAPQIDLAKVFVVHGRNGAIRESMFTFLRSIGLKPLEWSQAIELTGKGTPYVGEVLNAAFDHAQAVVVLFTPDDEARLRLDLVTDDDAPHEKNLTPQARSNVIFEAGMAMGRDPNRTILVEIGTGMRPFSDVGGRHVIRFNNSTVRRQELAQRLKTAGCPVELSGSDWHTVGDFTIADRQPELPIADTPTDTEQLRHIPDPASLQLKDDEIDQLLTIARRQNRGRVPHVILEHGAGDAATERFRAIIERFVDLGLMREHSEFWAITHFGYELVAKLRKSRASGEPDE